MRSLRRHSRPLDDRRPWLLLFFRQISLFFYGLLVRRDAVYVAWCYVGQHAAREGTSDQHL